MNIYEKLSAIQIELKVPKGQTNTFGNYMYRSAEDITEAAKPICAEHKTVLVVSDELISLGDRFYVKSTATLFDNESSESITVTANAREQAEKKGMDGAQITGAASSYARKYALNGLFCLDDTKDSDSNELAEQQKKQEKIDDSKEWDKANKYLLDTAKKCGFLPKQVEDKFTEKYGKPLYNASLKEMEDVTKKFEEMYAEKLTK